MQVVAEVIIMATGELDHVLHHFMENLYPIISLNETCPLSLVFLIMGRKEQDPLKGIWIQSQKHRKKAIPVPTMQEVQVMRRIVVIVHYVKNIHRDPVELSSPNGWIASIDIKHKRVPAAKVTKVMVTSPSQNAIIL